jgi:hypothetical protein
VCHARSPDALADALRKSILALVFEAKQIREDLDVAVGYEQAFLFHAVAAVLPLPREQ